MSALIQKISVRSTRHLSRKQKSFRNQKRKFGSEELTEADKKAYTLYSWLSIPVVAAATWYALGEEAKHHQEHHEHHEFPFLKIRNKEFPWYDGDNAMFKTLGVKLGGDQDSHH
eukprot:TRINITY_DN2702_c0_g3_i2.p1 TRINITY_DN2702_c0_g3~~TRINITY_DN2702_c0_g3_i2.p1  ORF type:complete len:114 (-),score=16.70 TRINITY_DN2702_c0_g3_i2:88-429(-)